jgi:hypothetical protein
VEFDLNRSAWLAHFTEITKTIITEILKILATQSKLRGMNSHITRELPRNDYRAAATLRQ